MIKINFKERIGKSVIGIGFLAMALLFLGLAGQGQAQDLITKPQVKIVDRPDGKMQAGDWITKDNWERAKGNTFDGKPIPEMLSESLIDQIKNWNLKIELKDYQKYEFPPEHQAFTQQFKGTVTLSDDGKKISGYKAGIPFEIDPNDPMVGWKAIWNVLYGRQLGDHVLTPKFCFVLIDGKRGYERIQWGEWGNYYYKNRTKVPPVPVHETPENFYKKNLLFFVYPFDIRGLGVLAFQYDDDRLEENFAYMRSVRRVRRLSASAWMDPIGGTDMLYDDQEVYNARPEWYDDFKYLGKKDLLIVRNMPYLIWNDQEKDIIKQYPRMELDTPPYWQPLGLWEPAPVHVIDCIMPGFHPYSHKVLYVDEEQWKPLLAEMYDRKGEFWKYFHLGGAPKPDPWGRKFPMSIYGHISDYQKMHSTQWNNMKDFNINPEGLTIDYFSVERLKAAGK